MRKEIFLEQLEYLTQDIPDADREEALAYYRDYLEEAASEDEEQMKQVLETIGSPERVAAMIRADINGNLADGGSFSETGFEDERFRDPNYQVAKRLDLPEERGAEHTGGTYQQGQTDHTSYHQRETYHDAAYREYYTKSRTRKDTCTQEETKKKQGNLPVIKWILLAVLLIVASPILLGIGGILAGVLALVAGTAVGLVLFTAAAFIASVVVACLGIGFVASAPLDSLFLFGLAVMGIGSGLLGISLIIVILEIFLPFCWKECGKWIGILTQKGKETA